MRNFETIQKFIGRNADVSFNRRTVKSFEMNSENVDTVSQKSVQNLTNGLLNIYENPLKDASVSLNELVTKQNSLIEAVCVQNQKLQSIQNNEVIKSLFTDIANSREQLMHIKKQMISLHDRTYRLRIRAQNIVAFAKNKQMARIAQLEHEQNLIGSHKS